MVSWEVERRGKGLGYLRQQLIVIDFPWIRKRRGIHDDPGKRMYLNPAWTSKNDGLHW